MNRDCIDDPVGQQTLKSFLDSISQDDQSDVSSGLSKTGGHEILEEVVGKITPDLMQTWSFASQTDNDRLTTLICSNFALLIRVLSSRLEGKDHAVELAKVLLQRDQLKLLAKGLSAESHKEHLISPCLRVLTEIVSVDGGILASQVLDHSEFTLNTRSLDRNLRLHRKTDEEDRRRSSVRSNTVRYLLAHLRALNIDGLLKLISIRSVFRNFLDHISQDPPELIISTLNVIENNVLRKQSIPRKYKSSLLSDHTLASVIDAIRLYTGDENNLKLVNTARTFLNHVCTEADLGIVLPCGWYPPNKTNAGIDDPEFNATNKYNIKATRNPILAKFIHHLRPHVILEERALLLLIFGTAQELVADYIRQAQARLQLAPKLTNTWIGYASLLYSIIDLPIPPFFGVGDTYRNSPPPIENIVENILPSPLSRTIMTKCLNQASSLITFFAMRILVTSLSKVKTIINMLKDAASTYGSYNKALEELNLRLASMFPAQKDVVNAFRTLHQSENMAKETTSHVLVLYQEIFPMAIQDDIFDASLPLASTLLALKESSLTKEEAILTELHLKHLLDLASSSGMKWWQRQGELEYSPFSTIIQLCAEGSLSISTRANLQRLLVDIGSEVGIVQSTTEKSSIDALLSSMEDGAATFNVLTFLDDCINRLVKKPVKYIDDLDSLLEDCKKSTAPISLLTMVLLEQLPFTSRLSKEGQREVLTWASRLFEALSQIGEHKYIIRKVKKHLSTAGYELPDVDIRNINSIATEAEVSLQPAGSSEAKTIKSTEEFDFLPIPEDTTQHPALIRYKSHDLPSLVHSPFLAELITYLSSPHPEIRTQALTALSALLPQIKAATSLEAKDQLWLLIGEIVETASGANLELYPLSGIGSSFACAALKVVLDASHHMFARVNRYLIKDPYWDVRKLVDWFLKRAILDPDKDMHHHNHQAGMVQGDKDGGEGRYWEEIAWILNFVAHGINRIEVIIFSYTSNCSE